MSSKQGFFESDDDYRDRISREADERTIENISGDAPRQGFFEGDNDYRERISREADEHTVEDSTGDAPHQGFFESDRDYRDRVSHEADERTVEDNTGDAPRQGFFESDDDYQSRVSQEADEIRSDDDDGNKSGCFLTTACVDFAGLPDDCHELTVLRSFRDTYMASRPDGPAMLREYYHMAPLIVVAINLDSNRRVVLDEMFATVRRAVAEIEAGKHERALITYRSLFAHLHRKYCDRN